MKHFIADHSPMDDYRNVLQQTAYQIDHTIENSCLGCDNREKLERKQSYRIIFRAMKLCLIMSGVLLAVVCVMLGILHNYDNAVLKKIGLYCALAVTLFFIAALVLGGVGGYMETYHTAKDTRHRDIKRHKTWVLLNGNIAVVNMAGGRPAQMLARYSACSSIDTEIPFSRMYIIDKVYAVNRKDHKVIARVNVVEYVLKYPFVNEYSDRENMEKYYNYYWKRTHRNIEWDENIAGINQLVCALNALKKGRK